MDIIQGAVTGVIIFCIYAFIQNVICKKPTYQKLLEDKKVFAKPLVMLALAGGLLMGVLLFIWIYITDGSDIIVPIAGGIFGGIAGVFMIFVLFKKRIKILHQKTDQE